MPRLRVIVLDKDVNDIGNTYRYALWADVPVSRQTFYANAANKSQWTGALASDNTNLQNGSVAESVSEQRVPTGATLAQVEAFLQTQWTNYQNYITNFNPWAFYGSTWDGTTWTITTVA